MFGCTTCFVFFIYIGYVFLNSHNKFRFSTFLLKFLNPLSLKGLEPLLFNNSTPFLQQIYYFPPLFLNVKARCTELTLQVYNSFCLPSFLQNPVHCMQAAHLLFLTLRLIADFIRFRKLKFNGMSKYTS